MFRRVIIAVLLFIRKLMRLLFDPVLGRTRIVLSLKVLFVSIASLLVLVLMTLPLLHDGSNDAVPAAKTKRKIIAPTMMNPRFDGVDTQDRPYHIEADTAIKTDQNKIVLTNVQADIELAIDKWVQVQAVQAVYHMQRDILDLLVQVSIFTNNGDELVTSTAHIDLGKHITSGRNGVKLKSDLGSLTADHFVIMQENRIFFEKNVQMDINPAAAKQYSVEN